MTAYLVSKTTKEHFLARNFSPADANDEDLILVKGDADGWIKWQGDKECPLPGDQRCEVINTSGDVFNFNCAKNIGQYNWTQTTAYRPVLEDIQQTPKDCVAVRYDLDPVRVEGAIRDKLIEMGWTPPKSERDKWVAQAAGVILTMTPYSELGNIYDALVNGDLPNPTNTTGGDA